MLNKEEWKRQDRRFHEDSSVIEAYDVNITKKYALEHKYLTTDKWVEEFRREGKKLVLDFGCGTGQATLKLLKAGIRTISVDASLGMLKKLCAKCGQNSMSSICIAADAEELPFKREVFEGLVCSGVLHHLPDIAKAIENQSRILKKGGLLFIAEPYKEKPWFSYPYFIFVSLGKSVWQFFKRPKVKSRERILSKLDLKNILESLEVNGFESNVSFIAYWPIACGYLPEFLGYPLLSILNKINYGSNKGDTFVIKAKKE